MFHSGCYELCTKLCLMYKNVYQQNLLRERFEQKKNLTFLNII